MKTKILSLIFMIGLMVTPVSAAVVYIKDLPVKVYISFDKQSYRLDEDITLNIEIKNTGADRILLYLAGYKKENFKVKLINLKNASLIEEKDPGEEDLKRFNPELFSPRDIFLYPDESYKTGIDLEDFYQLSEAGRYKIMVSFNPYPMKKDYIQFESNPVYIEIKPTLKNQIETEIINEIVKREESRLYTPAGMVQFMLDSKVRGDKDNYYLYQDLDRIIMNYDPYKEKYLKASDTMKKDIIEEFKKWDINRVDRQIAEYKIMDVFESFEDNTAIVKVMINYKPPAVFQRYVYQFNLEKKGIKWILKDMDVLTHLKK
ncbi:MAG: hypothetical protein JW827_02620 [Spirochaetes bacterium]|nr:hypothetical protein [Spirochaetota bacterium]